MITVQLLRGYIRWHLGIAFRELYEFLKNLSWFGYHFFSMPLLTKTLFRPIYRMHESATPGSGLNLELFFENLTFNFMARIVGFFLRILLLICGSIYQIIIVVIGPILFIIWLLLPILIPLLFVQGMWLIL